MSLKNEIVKLAPRGRINTIAPGNLLFYSGDIIAHTATYLISRLGRHSHGQAVAQRRKHNLPSPGFDTSKKDSHARGYCQSDTGSLEQCPFRSCYR